MIVREVAESEKENFNQVVTHPLQSWEWGEFRKETGLKVERIGFFHHGELQKAFQVTFHDIPHLGGTVGYLPKAFMPDEDQLSALQQLAKKHAAVFIKLEPNIAHKVEVPSGHNDIARFLEKNQGVPGRPLFTRHTFQLDLTKSEEKLFSQLDQKTRYNVNLAYKKGVTIYEDSSEIGLETYLTILAETTNRQGFYAHTPEYFRKMWSHLHQTGKMRIFHATYDNTVIVSWVIFIFNDFLYYPYGASRSIHREVMASNLMMWEMIRFGKEQNLKTFDMWGSLGPNADKKDAFYGFHRFKRGYGGDLMTFLGTYDIVYKPLQYRLFTIVDDIRWKWLRLRAKFSK